MKGFLLAVLFFVSLGVGLALLGKRWEAQERAANVEQLKEFTVRMREDFCAAHIGELKGAKHEDALKWFRTFALEGKEHRMSEADLKTCLAF
jgi:hypothetical protein